MQVSEIINQDKDLNKFIDNAPGFTPVNKDFFESGTLSINLFKSLS